MHIHKNFVYISFLFFYKSSADQKTSPHYTGQKYERKSNTQKYQSKTFPNKDKEKFYKYPLKIGRKKHKEIQI